MQNVETAPDAGKASGFFPPEAPTIPAPASPVTGAELAPAVELLPSAPPGESAALRDATSSGVPRKLWRVGTITYTAAGLTVLFLFLLAGDFALSMRDRSIGAPVQLMLKRLQASDTLMAFLYSTLPPMLSLIIGPIVSYRSDRLRSRWGRRIPYLMFPAPIAAAAMVTMSFSEPLGAVLSHLLGSLSPGPKTCALICFAPSWTIFECAAITAGAVMGGLINDVVPRPLLGRFYGMFRAISLIAGMVFNFWLIGASETHYRAIFISVAVVFLFGFSLMCLNVREGDYPPPEPVDHATSAGSRFVAAVRTYFRECFNLGYYRWVFAATTLAGAAFLPINLFSLPYARQIHMNLGHYGRLITLTYAISLVLSWPLGWLVDRAHPLRVSLLVLGIYGVTMTTSWFFVHDAKTFGIVLVIHGVLSGCYFTTAAPLGQTLFPRLKFTQFASAAALTQGTVIMFLGPLLGRLLDITHHDYPLTFLAAGALGISAGLCLSVVLTHFMKLGGPSGYIPPGAAPANAASITAPRL